MAIFHKDENGISTGFTLESADEVAEFKKLTDLAQGLRDKQRKRAERVFSAFIEGNEEVDINDPSDSASQAAYDWADKMSGSILNDLDHRSIGDFVTLILESHVKASQAAKAHKRHAENRAMKADVFTWLDSNMMNFKSMDAAAQAITRQQPIAFRTARDWVGEWKKVRSTGTP